MRRRLTVAILCLVAATLVVTTLSSYVLVRRAAIATSQQELSGQAAAISRAFTTRTDITRVGFRRELAVIADAGAFASITVLRLHPDGSITGTLPPGVSEARIDVPALRSGEQVTGHTRSLLVYTAVPVPIARVTAYVPVLVVTRQAHDPANGLRYFGLVGAIGLVIAALVAAGLARRFTRPLEAAAATTRRIASGDLDATVAASAHELPEFAVLAESINAMGANLVRAREQERQFLLSVSHELRTPLTSIRGYADAVIDGATDDPAAAAGVIVSEAGRLERLVQDLLDLARLDAHRFSLDLQVVDAADVARGVAVGFERRAAELDLQVTLVADSDRPLWVVADRDRLGQVVANLVENAGSFASARITVGVGAIDRGDVDGARPVRGDVDGAASDRGADVPGGGPDRWWPGQPPGRGRSSPARAVPAIWVTDDGPGIPEAELRRVFDRHFSSDRGQGRRKGTGLGLAIVSELAAAMGAEVEAHSPIEGGRGTGMVLWLRSAGEAVDGHPGPGRATSDHPVDGRHADGVGPGTPVPRR